MGDECQPTFLLPANNFFFKLGDIIEQMHDKWPPLPVSTAFKMWNIIKIKH